ncbi:MAG: hypothetical protein GU359_08080 [Desulfurococcales archaeon]|jgi:hypothetical protein|nr:hypothetical protein [Desulfurococcales archaeon]
MIHEKEEVIENMRRKIDEVEKDLKIIYSLQEAFRRCLEKKMNKKM